MSNEKSRVTEQIMSTDTAQNADGVELRTDIRPPALLYWGLQPSLLLLVYASGAGYLPVLNTYSALAIGLVALTLAERTWPARGEWLQDAAEWLQVLAMFAISAVSLLLIEFLVSLLPIAALTGLHNAVAFVWRPGWPLWLDVVISFSIMQFLAYWFHRWQHEITILWHMFGHGTHHSYTKLSAMNWNTAHPFEALFLAAPAAFVILVLGQSEAAYVAAGIVMIQAGIAHTNLRLNEWIFGLVLTTTSQHMHHHSARFREAQTNYGCAMIFWDRVFGTFEAGDTDALGDPMKGERTIWKRLTLPLRRPKHYKTFRYRRTKE